MMTSLELGHRELKCVCWERKGNTLLISRTDALSFSYDIFEKKDIQGTSRRIKEFFAGNKIPGQQIYLSLLHKDIIFQELLLPPMSQKEIEQVVINEIEKIPSFSSQGFVFAYHTYPHFVEGKKKIKVLYLAFFKSILDFSLKLLEASGFNLEGFDVTPLNLFSLQYAQSKPEDISLVVVEDAFSYVVVLHKKECRFIYLSNSGFDDIWDSKKGRINDLSYKAWVEEIKRAVKSYEVEDHKTVSGIILIWDNEKIIDLDKTVSSSFSYLKKKVSSPALPKQIRYERKAPLNYKYLPSIGAALQSLKIKHEFNLEKIWCRERTFKYRFKTSLNAAIYVGIIIVISAVFIFGFINKNRALHAESEDLSREVESLERRMTFINAQKDKYLKLREEVLKQASLIARFTQISWSKTFLKVGEILPTDVWLDSFYLDKGGTFEIGGYGLSLDSVAALVRALKNVNFFSDVKFSFIREHKIEDFIVNKFGVKSQVIIDIPRVK